MGRKLKADLEAEVQQLQVEVMNLSAENTNLKGQVAHYTVVNKAWEEDNNRLSDRLDELKEQLTSAGFVKVALGAKLDKFRYATVLQRIYYLFFGYTE